ncbi:MAG: tetratricopeptide repeat protein [Verrucomicrobia bacterium]|nr:tetratricopeptide repeat protein [Verrucomicrobiota bacterium]MBI3870067.1 tetratricopeptide repeat protein [Verrucomicrobiota bacterium]
MQTAPSTRSGRLFVAAAALIAAIWLAGCAHPGHVAPSPVASASERKPRSRPPRRVEKEEALAQALTAYEEARAEAYARFAAGLVHDIHDEEKQALENFEKSVEADPSQEGLALDVARRHLAQKEPERAIAFLREAMKRSRSGILPAFMASIHVSLGQTNEAIVANQEAIKRSPTLLIGYHNLANLYSQKGQADEAMKVLEQASQISNPSPQYLVELAELWLGFPQSKPERTALTRKRAGELLDRILKLKNLPTPLLQRAADGYMLLGQNAKAIDLYLKLVEQYPQVTPIRERLADLFLQSRDSKRAIEQMELLVKEEPSRYPQAYVILGSLALQDGKYKDAEDYLRKAVVLAPKYESAHYDLAIAQVNGGRVRQGLDTLEDARARFGETFQTEFFAGIAYARLKEYSNAVARLTTAEIIARAKETNRLTHLFYFQLGSSLERNKNLEEAEKAFRKVLEMKPDFSEAMNYLGYMWVENGMKLQEARGLIEKAVKIEPKNGAFLDSMAWVMFKLGKPKEALVWMKKAMEYSTDPDPTLWDHLGDIQSAAGDAAQAAVSWKKALGLEPNPEIQKKLDGTAPKKGGP